MTRTYAWLAASLILLTPVGSRAISSLTLSKTVGTNPASCAADTGITVKSGTDVTYCYTAAWSSGQTFTSHTLVDTELGNLPPGSWGGTNSPPFPAGSQLGPYTGPLVFTSTVNLTATTTNCATWTATNSYSSWPSNVSCAFVKIDSDGDGIRDEEDPNPGVNDPTGCFYDEATGEVRAGGQVGVTGPNVTENADGSSGCYNFFVDPTDGPQNYAISVLRYPPGCSPSRICTSSGTLDLDPMTLPTVCQEAPGAGALCTLGDSGLDGFVLPSDCASNPFFDELVIAAQDPDLLNNNIPLNCEPVAAPAMSPWALLGAVLLLSGLGLTALRRRNSSLS